MVMKIVLWFIFLSTLLVFSLGNTIILPVPIIKQTKKYKTPDDYYSDISASQGVFSRTIEPMSNASKSTFSGSNVNAVKGKSSNVKGVAAVGPNNSGYVVKGPNGIHTGSSPYGKDDVSQWKNENQPECADTLYGCCSDNTTVALEDGSNCPSSAPYGMCDDGVTPKNSSGSNCSTYPPSSPTIYILPVQSGTSTPSPYTPTQTQSTPYTQGPPPPTQPTQPPPPPPTQPVPYTTPTTTPSQPAPYTSAPTTSTSTTSTPTTSTPTTSTSTTTEPVPYSTPTQSSPYSTQSSSSTPTTPVQSSIQAYNTDTVFLSPPQSINSNCPPAQPCPPCGRCPEPSFDCKKVPNYSSTNSEYLPVPVLNDFSQFGM